MLRDAGEYATAPDVIQLSVDTTATVAMDFKGKLNPSTDLLSISSATVDEVESGIAPGLANQALSQDRKQAHVEVTASTVGRYKIKIAVTSTDSQTFAGYGWLHVE